MVEFEEIKDEHYRDADDINDDEDQWSDESADDDVEDDETSLQSETIMDRIAALKDIIPARQRDAIARTVSTAYSYGTMATFLGGKVMYVLITSVLMLGIPYALTLEEDRMLTEHERHLQMSQEMSGVSLSWLRLLSNYLLTCLGYGSYRQWNTCC
jgi:mitochondrial import receptor subunit TOM22